MNLAEISKDNIKGFECRHATYTRSNQEPGDALVVKEYVHLKDGQRIPRIRIHENYEREFWVTREGRRNHKQKKEWEKEQFLQKFKTPQYKLLDSIARALGRPGMHGSLRQIARSPYLYGCDISTTSLIKADYQKRWPDCVHPSATVAVMDIETDVVWGTGEVILVTLSYKDRIYTAINQRFVQNIANCERQVQEAFEKYLGEIKKKRNITLEVGIGATPGECIYQCAMKAHAWMPDFVVFWNINFDMPKMLSALEKEGYDPADVFSDPAVPIKFRHFNYREGAAQKVTQGGKVIPLHPAERWHTVQASASFYFLDAMCVYKRLRTANGNEPSYSLDYILRRNKISDGKLSFTETDHITNKLEWHQVMQSQYKIEYVIYNIFDCISVEMLDEKTGDISSSFPNLCELSDYANFTSNPRRIADDLHYVCRERGLVIATTADEMVEEDDKLVVDLTDWVVTLPSTMMVENGIPLIRELPTLRSSMRVMNSDLDVTSTYPTVEEVANISKETTHRELAEIKGVSDVIRREVGVNLSGGEVNAIEHCHRIHNLPLPSTWLQAFEEDMNHAT